MQLRSRRSSSGGGGGNLLPLFFGFGVLLGALLMASILLGLRLAVLDNTTSEDAAVKLTHQINANTRGGGGGGGDELSSSGRPSRIEEVEARAGNPKRDVADQRREERPQGREEQPLPRSVPERSEEVPVCVDACSCEARSTVSSRTRRLQDELN